MNYPAASLPVGMTGLPDGRQAHEGPSGME